MQSGRPTSESPMHFGAGNLSDHIVVAERLGRRLVGIREVAQRALDKEVHDRDADIGQQQRRDRLVDSARVAQEAGEADPEAADEHRENRHDDERQHRRHVADHRDRQHGRGEAAEHERAFAADHDEADARGYRHRERGEDQAALSAAGCSAVRTRFQSRLARRRRRSRPATCRLPAERLRTAPPRSEAQAAE